MFHIRCLELLFRAVPEDKEQGDLDFQFSLTPGRDGGENGFLFPVSQPTRLEDLREGAPDKRRERGKLGVLVICSWEDTY